MKKLERKLSLSAVIAISVAGMLGSGIFVLPGIAAAKTGSSIWLAYLIAAICILPAALSKSELATAMPKSGGAYVYIERALGPLFGTISGIGLWLSLLLKSSFALVGFGAYLLVLTNISPIYIKYFSIGFLILIMLLNIFGVKKVGKVQLVIVILSLLTLLSLLFLGIPVVDKQLLTPFMTNGTMGLISTVAFVYISYAGVTKIAAIAGEVKNPSRNIPLAMLLSLLVISSIYVSVAYTLVGNVPLDLLATDIKPIHTLGAILGGEWFAYGVAVIGVITLISMANSGVLASSRFPFAMAMDKLLPSNLAKIHEKHLTPINTILLTCLMMALIILFLDVEKIVKLASAFKVSMFITVNICVIVLRETAVQWYKPTYKSPLYPYVQLFGIFSGLVLLFYLGWMPILVLLIIALIGSIIYYSYGINASRTGVLRNYGHRAAKFLFFRKTNDDNADDEISNYNLSDEKHKDWLDGQINPEAGVIIPLFGNEYSPESLVELGAALNQKKSIQVVNIKEVPDQTFLDAVLSETPKIKSLKRQLSIVQDLNKLDLDFESIVTHNVSDTMQVLSDHSKSDWLLLSWDGRISNGFLINNPLGWIVSNINSNFALFKDNGVRYIREVVLAVRPNSRDIRKLIDTTANLCKFYNASFTLLHVVSEDNTKDNLKKIKKNTESLLTEYKDIAILRIETSEDPSESVSELTADYDLLILGTPQKDTFKSMLFGTGKDKFAANSSCSVLRLTIKE